VARHIIFQACPVWIYTQSSIFVIVCTPDEILPWLNKVFEFELVSEKIRREKVGSVPTVLRSIQTERDSTTRREFSVFKNK
jgi:hypothetical protein